MAKRWVSQGLNPSYELREASMSALDDLLIPAEPRGVS
jgi:hypothetical protein